LYPKSIVAGRHVNNVTARFVIAFERQQMVRLRNLEQLVE
jgi:hypothetical protein